MAFADVDMEQGSVPATAQRSVHLLRAPLGTTSRMRMLAEETPVAFVYGGSTEAVMMATPADLEDFAVGFSLTEGIIDDPAQVRDITVVPTVEGIELRIWLMPAREDHYRRRRRRLAGPVGCGLCGVESLAAAVQPVRSVRSAGCRLAAADIAAALETLTAAQFLNQSTHATHAAGLYVPGAGLVALREDVGRHNALDKLAGAIARGNLSADAAAVVITSRVSIELVQKTAAIGAAVLIAMSAPTALAIRTANAADMTLIAIARGDSFEIFAGAHRLAE